MKKTVLFFVILFMTNFVDGQTSSFTFGPQIGWTSTKISTDLHDNYSGFSSASKSGFQYGAFFRFGKRNYIQPEVYFSTKGGIMNYDVTPSPEVTAQNVSQDLILRTIDIPLLFGHNIIYTPEMNFRVFAGPTASFIMNKKINLKKGTDNGLPLTKNDFKDNIWAGQIGAGIDVFMISFNVRYEFGLNDISDSPNLSKTRDNIFLFSLGWKLFY